MSISFRCECGHSLKAGDDSAGKRVKCPECGQSVAVPRAGAGEKRRTPRKAGKPPPDNAPQETKTKAIAILLGGTLLGAAALSITLLLVLRGNRSPKKSPPDDKGPAAKAEPDAQALVARLKGLDFKEKAKRSSIHIALRKRPREEVVKALSEALEDKDPLCRAEAALLLMPNAVADIRRALKHKCKEVRYRAAVLLAYSGKPDLKEAAKPVVLDAARSKNVLYIDLWGFATNVHLQPVSVSMKARMLLMPHYTNAGYKVPGLLGKQEAVDLFAKWLDDPDRSLRTSALFSLGDLNPEARPLVPALRKALKDKEPANRVSAARAVWRLAGDAEAVVPVLVEALKASKRSDHLLLMTLKEVGPQARAAIPALQDLRKRVKKDERRGIEDTLRKIDPYWRLSGP